MDSFKRWVNTLIPVPIVYQSHNYDCGSACLRAICLFYGVGPEDEDEFIDACNTSPEGGTLPEDIIRAAKFFGLKTMAKEGLTIELLKKIIDSGRPVICAIQAYDEDKDITDHDSGHYVVAIGYDEHNILFQDPSIKNNRRGRLTYNDFQHRWHDVDKNGRLLRRFGIVLWRNDMPKDVDFDTRASRIK